MAAAALATVILAGCDANPLGPHNVTTATDRQRLAVMRSDPAFRTTVPGTAYFAVGQTWGPDSWRRGQVAATIYQRSSPADTMSPLPVQAFVRSLIGRLQSRGWVIYYAACTFVSLTAQTPPGVLDGPTWWYSTLYGYRIYRGVSYWASILTNANERNGPGYTSDVKAIMIVPAASERANLFRDHPAGLPASAVCAARPAQLTTPVTQGPPIRVSPESDRVQPSRPGPADTSR